jgi:hypothetical protein
MAKLNQMPVSDNKKKFYEDWLFFRVPVIAKNPHPEHPQNDRYQYYIPFHIIPNIQK